LPLHGFSAGTATATGTAEAYGASCGTLSWISARGGDGMGTVGDGRGGTVNPGGGGAGDGAVTPAGCGRRLRRTCAGVIAVLTARGVGEHTTTERPQERHSIGTRLAKTAASQ
jgi:hypothetical protein